MGNPKVPGEPSGPPPRVRLSDELLKNAKPMSAPLIPSRHPLIMTIYVYGPIIAFAIFLYACYYKPWFVTTPAITDSLWVGERAKADALDYVNSKFRAQARDTAKP